VPDCPAWRGFFCSNEVEVKKINPIDSRTLEACLRLKRTATTVVGTALLVCALLLTAGAALAFDPPRIIGVLTNPQYPNGFATDFACIRDMDSDGDDELLVSHYRSPFEVYLYSDEDSLDNSPAFTFRSYEDGLLIGRNIGYLGHLNGGGNRYMGYLSVSSNRINRIDLYHIDREVENDPYMTLTITGTEDGPWLDGGFRNRPTDFNGDGYDDVVIMRFSHGLQVYYGGEQLDSTIDWEVTMHNPFWSGGLDVNDDSFDDMLVYNTEDDTSWYSLFLGGNPPDTITAVRIRAADYALTETFAILPDMNGDGYDEWGIYWNTFEPNDDGFLIFLGSENPDGVPDIRLEGARSRWMGSGSLVGGDFNGDDYGDVAVRTAGGPDGGFTAEMMLHFGNRWLAPGENEHHADLHIDLTSEFDGRFEYLGNLGATGDYNGDGVDDFVGNFGTGAVVFAGNRGWQVGVSDPDIPPPQEMSLSLNISPNPFNDKARVSFSITQESMIDLSVYKIEGRKVSQLDHGIISAGEHSVELADIPTGLYFVSLRTPQKSVVRKLVCLK